MVKRDNSKAAFTARLIEACQSAGVTGHGRNKLIADTMKRNGCKVSTPGVWKWFNAQSIPDSGNIVALSKILDVRAEWLEYGVGNPSANGGINHMFSENPEKTYRVELLDLTVSAGPGTYMLSEYVEVLHAIEFTTEHAMEIFGKRAAADVKVMTIDGDSMSPTMKSGDRLFFDISVRNFVTDGVYAFVYDRTFHVKRLQKQGSKMAVLSDNPTYEKWYVEDEDQFYVMGKALIHESLKYNKL